jgi:hypothetical protein
VEAYTPDEELVVVLLKEWHRSSAYRVRVTRPEHDTPTTANCLFRDAFALLFGSKGTSYAHRIRPCQHQRPKPRPAGGHPEESGL